MLLGSIERFGDVFSRAFSQSGVTTLLEIMIPRAKVATITMLVVADNPPIKAKPERAMFSVDNGSAST